MRMLLCHLLAAAVSVDIISCQVVFQHDTDLCIDEVVEYQCTVTGSPNTLTWSVLQEDGKQFGLIVTYGGSGIGASATIGGVFSVEQLSFSPSIISSISFTVQSSINGYSIFCQDINLNNENFTINIADAPPPPDNISSSFSHTEVLINWTPPSYTSHCQCVASYTVNTTSTVISTTDTSVTIPLAGLSPGIYCVSVASVDTANRTGTYSEEKCYTLSVPAQPALSYSSYEGSTSTSAVVTLSWNFVEVVPPLISVYVLDNVTNTVVVVPADDNDSVNITIVRGINYLLTVYGENILANGTTTELLINVAVITSTNHLPVVCTATSTVSTVLVVITTGYSYCQPTPSSPVSTNGLSSSVSAGISVAITVPVTAIITVLVTIIILYLCGYQRHKQWTPPPQEYETPVASVEMKSISYYQH